VDEAKLLEGARAGSEEAFCRLVRLHQGRIRAFLSAYARNPDVADDLAQEVFLTAFQSLRTYKGDAPLGLWLLGIARHRALRYLRDEARRRAREGGKLAAVLAALQADQAEAEPDSPQAFDQEVRALQNCLESLPPESSQIVAEHYFRGRSLVMLARQMGRNESSLRVSLLRIRGALRRCVEGKLGVEGA
jgi:RNA polymerase sigma-70 factor (ECF subfamily)